MKNRKTGYLLMVILPFLLMSFVLAVKYRFAKGIWATVTYFSAERLVEMGYFTAINVFVVVFSLIIVIAGIVGLFLERYGKKRDVTQCCDKKDDNNEVVNS